MWERLLNVGQIKSLKYVNPDYQVRVDWMITMRCNYDCSYCASHDNSKPFNLRTLNEYIDSMKYLKQHFGNQKIQLQLIGGEPTLFKEWPSLINWGFNNGIIIETISNLSFPADKYIHKLDISHEHGIYREFMSGSYHAQFADDDLFLYNAVKLQEEGYLKSIGILGDPENWDRVEKMYYTLKEKINHISINRIRYEDTSIIGLYNKYLEYTPEQDKLIATNKQEDHRMRVEFKDGRVEYPSQFAIIDKYSGEFKGMKCAVGRDRIHINEYGDVYPSACLMNFPRARMGNIFKQNLIKPGGPVTCPFNKCGCGPDIKIEKWA